MNVKFNAKVIATYGIAMKGVLYFLLGALAILSVNSAHKVRGSEEVLQYIQSQEQGLLFLGVISIGLAAYALYRLYQAVFLSTGDDGIKDKVTRIGYLLSSLIYGLLSYQGISMIMNWKNGNPGVIAQLLSSPMGLFFLWAIGIVLFGRGIFEIYRGWAKHFTKNIKTYQIESSYRNWLVKAGQIGHIARGIVFCASGFLVIRTAYQSQEYGVASKSDALRYLGEAFGSRLLILIAAGLVIYGLYLIFRARYEKVQPKK